MFVVPTVQCNELGKVLHSICSSSNQWFSGGGGTQNIRNKDNFFLQEEWERKGDMVPIASSQNVEERDD